MKRLSFILGDTSTTIAGLICLTGLGGFLLWAIFAQLSEGITVIGQIVVEDNRKVIQHLEGGIVRKLNVVEGTSVQAGAIIMELEDVRAKSERDQAAQRAVALIATLDRLNALALEIEDFNYSDMSSYDVDPIIIDQTKDRQTTLFTQKRETLRTELAVLTSREGALRSSATAKTTQINTVQKSIKVISEELKLKQSMLADKLVRIDEVQRLEREEAALQGDLVRLKAEKQYDLSQAAETIKQISSVKAQSKEQISSEIIEARNELLAVQEQFNAASDVLKRTIIRAPQSGVVMNMKFFTLGGVVGPGEDIMEIVPQNTALLAEVKINPSDRDSVFEGLAVKARLSAYKEWLAPQVDGKVLNVSADLKTIPETGESYYEARILLDSELMQESSTVKIIPGMPVEAFIASGNKRTLIDYLFEPITAVMRRGTQMN